MTKSPAFSQAKCKLLFRKMQLKFAVLISDDTTQEKPYTDENQIVCWHQDHLKEHSIKGIDFVSALNK